MQADSEGARATTDDLRCLRVAQAIPRPQQQWVAVPVAQRRKRRQKLAIDSRVDGLPRRRLGHQPLSKGCSALSPTEMVRAHPTRDAEQPRQRVAIHLIEPSPSRQECLGNHILHGCRLDAPGGIATYRRVLLAEHALELGSCLAHPLHVVRQGPGITDRRPASLTVAALSERANSYTRGSTSEP